MLKACELIKGTIYSVGIIIIQNENIENIHDLGSERYYYNYSEFNASIPLFIHGVV